MNGLSLSLDSTIKPVSSYPLNKPHAACTNYEFNYSLLGVNCRENSVSSQYLAFGFTLHSHAHR